MRLVQDNAVVGHVGVDTCPPRERKRERCGVGVKIRSTTWQYWHAITCRGGGCCSCLVTRSP